MLPQAGEQDSTLQPRAWNDRDPDPESQSPIGVLGQGISHALFTAKGGNREAEQQEHLDKEEESINREYNFPLLTVLTVVGQDRGVGLK
jgi:hypothetical protein